MQNIEIEIRGPITKKEYDDLIFKFEKEGKKTGEKDRVLIDYSTGEIENRKKDIRLRDTNGIPEIMIKLGAWGATDQREEISVLAQPKQFDSLVKAFAALGYKKGVLCHRKTKVFEYQGIEFALVEVPNHSYYFEAEKMVDENEDKDKATQEILSVCQDLGLRSFGKKEFFDYIRQLNDEANEIFEAEKQPKDYFKNRFNI